MCKLDRMNPLAFISYRFITIVAVSQSDQRPNRVYCGPLIGSRIIVHFLCRRTPLMFCRRSSLIRLSLRFEPVFSTKLLLSRNNDTSPHNLIRKLGHCCRCHCRTALPLWCIYPRLSVLFATYPRLAIMRERRLKG